MALAYLLGKPAAKLLKVDLNVPLILVLSLIPDVDILFKGFIPHRGPVHSVISAVIVFVPFFVFYRKRAVPYFLGLVSHSLIGDFLVGGQIMLFWPLTSAEFGLHELGSYFIAINDLVNIALELVLFVVVTLIMFKADDLGAFFRGKKSNLLLGIPIFAVLLPSVARFPLNVPILLIPPHLFYLIMFSVSVLITLFCLFKNGK
jgi:hypothetical protein